MSQTRYLYDATTQHIQVLPGNSSGHDYVIGDIHGNLTALNLVIKSLKKNDRLFVVGDMTDRGKNSLGVVKTLFELSNTEPRRIHIARGNHEELCLRTIRILNKIFTKLHKMEKNKVLQEILSINQIYACSKLINDPLLFNQLQNHHANGGKWLIELFIKEYRIGHIKIKKNKLNFSGLSFIKKIYQFFKTLPFILHIDGKNPFNVVHADMPVGDAEFSELLNGNRKLNDQQIDYALWARIDHQTSKSRSTKKRNISQNDHLINSVLCFVGHSSTLADNQTAVRKNRNTINLDAATYLNNCFIVVDAIKMKCKIISTDLITNEVKMSKKHISDYLKQIKAMRNMKKNETNAYNFFKLKNTLDTESKIEKTESSSEDQPKNV